MFPILPFHTLSNRQLLKFKKSIESELYVVESESQRIKQLLEQVKTEIRLKEVRLKDAKK